MKLAFAVAAGLCLAMPAFAQMLDPLPPNRGGTTDGLQLPPGGDCVHEITRYRAIQENDLKMGHVAQSVYNQIKTEIAAAERVCSGGNDSKARMMILSSKRKHGYPADL